MASTAMGAFVGNLTKDPRKGESGGKTVINFTVAVTTGWGEREKVTYWELSLWEKQAEALFPMLFKGTKVWFSGEPYLDVQEKDGTKYYKPTIGLPNVKLLSTKAENEALKARNGGGGTEEKEKDPFAEEEDIWANE